MTVGIDAYLTLTNNVYDIELDNSGDIKSEDFFDSAILVSLFAESRASESEVSESHMRRGWIGNESTPGFEIGSKIWIYEQARLTRTVLNGITTAARQSLQWLIDSGYAESIVTSASITITGVRLDIKINRPNSKVEHRYYDLWDNTGVPSPEPQLFFQLIIPTEDLDPIGATSFAGYNIFDKIGNPDYAVDVLVYVENEFCGRGSPAITTGIGWHPDSTITIHNEQNNFIVGSGGRGGRGGETSADGGVGSGGNGGNSFGFGGLPNGNDGNFVVTPDVPPAGSATGGVEDRIAGDGEQGFPGIEMFHPITLINGGAIVGGCGGGGGGGIDGGDGGEGGVHGFQFAPNSGDPGTGTDPGTGGGWNFAIITNGYDITYNPIGNLRGGVS